MSGSEIPRRLEAVLFDRDGTLVADGTHDGDPHRVDPMPGAARALSRLRAAGIRVGVITSRPRPHRGRPTPAELDAVTTRVESLLGPFDIVIACPHRTEDGCDCREPAPGLVRDACRLLGVVPPDTLVVGGAGAGLAAAAAAGADAVLVPTPLTRPEEFATAPRVATTLAEVADLACALAASGARP